VRKFLLALVLRTKRTQRYVKCHSLLSSRLHRNARDALNSEPIQIREESPEVLMLDNSQIDLAETNKDKNFEELEQIKRLLNMSF